MTERRRKTRKKDLAHGDLFHVYIASDTPPEVCEFLSRLKQRGDFSYEILQIIENHVKGSVAEAQSVAGSRAVAETDSVSPRLEKAAASIEDTSDASSGRIEVPFENEHTGLEEPSTDQVKTSVDVQAEAAPADPTPAVRQPESTPEPETESPTPTPKMDPIQLLRQQRRAWVANSST